MCDESSDRERDRNITAKFGPLPDGPHKRFQSRGYRLRFHNCVFNAQEAIKTMLSELQTHATTFFPNAICTTEAYEGDGECCTHFATAVQMSIRNRQVHTRYCVVGWINQLSNQMFHVYIVSNKIK